MMPRHNEFKYIESCVAVRGYTPGRRLNAYKIRGYCLLLTVNKFPGAIQYHRENLFNVVKGVLKTSSSDEVIVFYACTIFAVV